MVGFLIYPFFQPAPLFNCGVGWCGQGGVVLLLLCDPLLVVLSPQRHLLDGRELCRNQRLQAHDDGLNLVGLNVLEILGVKRFYDGVAPLRACRGCLDHPC